MNSNGCPFKNGLISLAGKTCPFIRSLVQTEKDYAAIGVKTETAFLHNSESFAEVYEVFHGSIGVLPHSKTQPKTFRNVGEGSPEFTSESTLTANKCPYPHTAGVSLPLYVPANAASISLSSNFMQMPSDDEGSAQLSNIKSIFFSKDWAESSSNSISKNLQQPPPPKNIRISEELTPSLDLKPPNPRDSFLGSKCPISRIPIAKNVVGGLLHMEPPDKGKNWKGKRTKVKKFECPAVVVRARAAFAATAPMRALRPQELHIRICTVAATSLVSNIPLGSWREHLVKFSPAWFVAVHASIPLVVMMRKAVLLPKYAIIATIGCAIFGQFVGSRAERWRLLQMPIEDNMNASIAKNTPCGFSSRGIVAKSLVSGSLKNRTIAT
mmetsp:Transcript_8585/g.11620  ORF Transcript_8585/g.11620 Transcript_8585/m.11620 type:complete len:382 (+) Transcript_8585:212-1357(+)